MPSYLYATPQFQWTDEAVARLVTMDSQGMSGAEIAAALSHEFKATLSRSAVIGKRSRMGLCTSAEMMKAKYEQMRKARTPLPKPVKPPKETRLKPTAKATASSDRVRRLQEVKTVEEVKPELIALDPKPITHPDFGGCRWPLGLTENGERMHCTNDRGDLRPYCAGHKRMAYQASRSPAQIAHDTRLREASQRAHAEKNQFARVNFR